MTDKNLHMADSWHNPNNMEEPNLSFIQYDTQFLHKGQMMDGFEDYWQPWETGSHWELKREFIETYKDVFTKERLLCLAQAYCNIILMNCQYPDRVMQQISVLAKPLQMRKRFQNVSWDTEVKRSINGQESEKTNSIYEQYERPFKQIKISADEEQSSSTFLSTSVLQPSMEQFINSHPVPLCNKQSPQITSELKQSSASSSLDVKTKLEPRFKIKDIFVEKEKGDRIISALGLTFIQKFAELVKQSVFRFSIPIEIIQSTCYRLGYRNDANSGNKNNYHYEIDVDPDSPSTYYSRFFINDCEVCCETSLNKKKAKALVAEAAIHTLVKLSTFNFNRIKSYNPGNKTRTNFHKTVRKSTNSMKIFEIFQRNISNRTKVEPAIITLKSIASLLDMEHYIDFDIVSNTVSPTETHYACKFFLNDMLISHAKDETSQCAKNIAVDLGLMKLLNLEDYEILKGGLKKKGKHNKTVNSYSKKPSFDVGTDNFEKPSFVLNDVLYDSSLKDSFVVVERDRQKINIEKDLRLVISGCANFCKRKFEFLSEDVPGHSPPIVKVKALIGNEVVGVGVDFRKEVAKTIACCRAYIDLKKKYYTLRIKDEHFEGFIVDRDQVFQGESYTKNVIRKSNIKLRRLRKRCNRGENTTAKESSTTDTSSEPTKPSITDISSPSEKPSIIDANSQPAKPSVTDSNSQPEKLSISDTNSQPARPLTTETNCQEVKPSIGDTSSQNTKPHNLYLFRDNVTAMLKEFSESENYCDLLFAEDFTPVENREIHKIARKFHLLPALFQEEDLKKFMRLSHQYNIPKLLKYLVNNKGCTSKFELIDDTVTKYDL